MIIKTTSKHSKWSYDTVHMSRRRHRVMVTVTLTLSLPVRITKQRFSWSCVLYIAPIGTCTVTVSTLYIQALIKLNQTKQHQHFAVSKDGDLITRKGQKGWRALPKDAEQHAKWQAPTHPTRIYQRWILLLLLPPSTHFSPPPTEYIICRITLERPMSSRRRQDYSLDFSGVFWKKKKLEQSLSRIRIQTGVGVFFFFLVTLVSHVRKT